MALGLDLDYLDRSARGEFDLGWLRNGRSEWGVHAKPSKTGLTMRDIAIGTYGEVPDHAPRRTMAPRGSDIDPDVPDLGYTINDKADASPYVYVLVNKVEPENLTLWNNGAAQYVGIAVNTGAPGADTTDGTYAVFEHVRFSDMKGTNPDGSTYNDPNVPYASYFNGGDALHGFIRATYGSPQSNGCVEMSYADAALVWPLTPIGTLVTVEGPNYGSAPPPTTTTTTTAPPATTTTAPAPAPATTTTAPPAATTTTAAPA